MLAQSSAPRPFSSRLALLAATVVAATALAGPVPVQAAAKPKAPRLTSLACVPKTLDACRKGVTAAVGQSIQLRGTRLARKQRVTFRWATGAKTAKLGKTRAGWTAKVPKGTRAGTVKVSVTDRAGRRSNARKIKVVLANAISPPPALGGPPRIGEAPRQLPAAFTGNAFWIFDVSKVAAGDLNAIGARAKAANVETLFVKSTDGVDDNPQFTAGMVAAFHAQGLKVCAWQFIYGNDPVGEATAAARAVSSTGADCLVVNAEDSYGRLPRPYASAQGYMKTVRQLIVDGQFPVGFTSHAQVSVHRNLPYSVFLGPGGAQANLPQVYWADAGQPVDVISASAAAENRVYGVPLAPVGQTYPTPAGVPDPADARRFRAVWSGYGATGLSWYAMETTTDPFLAVLGEPAPAKAERPEPGWAALSETSNGDQVIWLQQHLASVEPVVDIDGQFGPTTAAALRRFQASRGLRATGATDGPTWQALLLTPVKPVDWLSR